MRTKVLTVSIQCNPARVYAFVSDPENLPVWASSFCRSIQQIEGEWIAQTPEGAVKIRFVSKNSFGILDHYVQIVPGTDVYVPMRVIPNGDGSEVIFTLFQSSFMTDEKFNQDIAWVEKDLQSLKRVLE